MKQGCQESLWPRTAPDVQEHRNTTNKVGRKEGESPGKFLPQVLLTKYISGV